MSDSTPATWAAGQGIWGLGEERYQMQEPTGRDGQGSRVQECLREQRAD